MSEEQQAEKAALLRTISVAHLPRESQDGSEPENKKSHLRRWDSVSRVVQKVNRAASNMSEVVMTRQRKKTQQSLRGTRKPKQSTMRFKKSGRGVGAASVSSVRSSGTGTRQHGEKPPRGSHQVYGEPLDQIMVEQHKSKDPEAAKMCIPLFVNKFMEHISVRGSCEEGMLRIAASREETANIQLKINNNEIPNLYQVSIHTIGDLLKQFIREVPGGLLDDSKHDRWMAIGELESQEEQAKQIEKLLGDLDVDRRALISCLMTMLYNLKGKEEYTRMTANGLARVIAPNAWDKAGSADNLSFMQVNSTTTSLIETMIVHYEFIFRIYHTQYPIVKTIDFKQAANLRPSQKRVPTHRAVPGVPPVATVPNAHAENAVAPVAEPSAAETTSESTDAKSSMAEKRPSSSSLDDPAVARPLKRQASVLAPTHTKSKPSELVRAQTHAYFSAQGSENEDGNSPRKQATSKMMPRRPVDLALGSDIVNL